MQQVQQRGKSSTPPAPRRHLQDWGIGSLPNSPGPAGSAKEVECAAQTGGSSKISIGDTLKELVAPLRVRRSWTSGTRVGAKRGEDGGREGADSHVRPTGCGYEQADSAVRRGESPTRPYREGGSPSLDPDGCHPIRQAEGGCGDPWEADGDALIGMGVFGWRARGGSRCSEGASIPASSSREPGSPHRSDKGMDHGPTRSGGEAGDLAAGRADGCSAVLERPERVEGGDGSIGGTPAQPLLLALASDDGLPFLSVGHWSLR